MLFYVHGQNCRKGATVNPATYCKQSYHVFSREADLDEAGEESMRRVEVSWASVGAVGLRSRRRMVRHVKANFIYFSVFH